MPDATRHPVNLTAPEMIAGIQINRTDSGLWSISVPQRSPEYPAVVLDGEFYESETGAFVSERVGVLSETAKLGAGAIICAGARLYGDNEIGPKTVVRERVFMSGGASIGAGSIIGAKSELEVWTYVGDNVYLGSRVKLKKRGLNVPNESIIGARQELTKHIMPRDVPIHLPSIKHPSFAIQ